MTEARKEWAEGLRETLALAIYTQGAYCGDCEYEGWDSCADCRRCVMSYVDAVLAVVEPRVISLAGEVERLTEALDLIASTDPVDAALDPDRAIRVAAAALSPHPSERKGP